MNYQDPVQPEPKTRTIIKYLTKRKPSSKKFGLPYDMNQYILWMLTPKALILLDIYCFFLKIFFIAVEQFIKPDTWYGSLIVVAVFGIKIPSAACFLCGRTKSQIYFTSAAFII